MIIGDPNVNTISGNEKCNHLFEFCDTFEWSNLIITNKMLVLNNSSMDIVLTNKLESFQESGVKQLVWMIPKKQSRGVLSKRCSENMQQTYRRTPMPKCDFN